MTDKVKKEVETKKTTTAKKAPLKKVKELEVGQVSKDGLWEVKSLNEGFVTFKPTAKNKEALGLPSLEKDAAKDLMEK